MIQKVKLAQTVRMLGISSGDYYSALLEGTRDALAVARGQMVEVERASRETKFLQGGTDTWGVMCTYGRRGLATQRGVVK